MALGIFIRNLSILILCVYVWAYLAHSKESTKRPACTTEDGDCPHGQRCVGGQCQRLVRPYVLPRVVHPGKTNGFNFVASGTAKKQILFLKIKKNIVIKGKVTNNKMLSLSQIVVGSEKQADQYMNIEHPISEEDGKINVTFRPAISVGPVTIYGLNMNTNTKKMLIRNNNYVTLSEFTYKQQILP